MESIFTDEDYMLWILFSQTRNAIFKIRKQQIAEYGVSPRQAGVLLVSEATNGEVSPYQLSKWSGVEHHTISELAMRMEKRGLLERISSLTSRKTISLKLTPKGIEIANHVRNSERYHELWSCLLEEERKQLKSILLKLRGRALKMLRINGELPFPPY